MPIYLLGNWLIRMVLSRSGCLYLHLLLSIFTQLGDDDDDDDDAVH